MEFGDNNFFRVTFCRPEGTYLVDREFLVFTFWTATACDSSEGPVNFDAVAIADAVHLFSAEGPSIDNRGIAFRVPCRLLP